MDAQGITSQEKEEQSPPSINGLDGGGTGYEGKQTKMVWTCGKKRGNTLAPKGSKLSGHQKTSRETQEKLKRETIEEDAKTSGISHMDPTDTKAWKAAIK